MRLKPALMCSYGAAIHNVFHAIVDEFYPRPTSCRQLSQISDHLSLKLFLHCYYSASFLITLFCQGAVAGPPYTDCYPTAPSLLCGWSDGLEWSPGCAAFDASSLLGSFFSLVLRPHCLT